MLNYKDPTIAIIDSGIGGVSILRQLINKYKAGNYIYYADNLFMPYGNKTQEWLRCRMDYIINLLQNKFKVDYIIIGCNTASCNVDSCKYSNVKTLNFDLDETYFATSLTKKSLPNKNIIADSTLAGQIETNICNTSKMDKIIKHHIKCHKLNELKSFILGCTHYELLKPVFEKYCPRSKIINNSSNLISKLNFNIKSSELNLVVFLSKQSERLESSILDLALN